MDQIYNDWPDKAPTSAYELQYRQEREHNQILSCGLRKEEWVYQSLAELETTDLALKDGMDEKKEQMFRRRYLHIIYKAGSILKIPPWGLSTAAVLAHRFYSKKSMKKNDTITISMACLHLAAKVQESPKPIRDVILQCERLVQARNPQLSQLLREVDSKAHKEYMESLKEQVLMAERAVLYALDFNLHIEHPHATILSELGKLDIMDSSSNQDYRNIPQMAWNFINDSFRTIISLQYEPRILAISAIYLANEINKSAVGKSIEQLIREKSGVKSNDFYSYFGISVEEIKSVTSQILEMYVEAKKWQNDSASGVQRQLQDVHSTEDNKRKLEVKQEDRDFKMLKSE
ncbi:hypothetical protein CEUSTIGMA_g4863.t1 [Chlamydomonas eustigma]|uniref:Cyclin N-terminal domain-containing protein n=1 Tax=Chlamydomonas eustigma TaxID=1157962 RepID=A0A250X2X0_9CHLO|nr:hypothetical protein CEUSTIGMA_g4863.t1 [Chlamydomonas eustigma]|eukprot:GAX77418.1 hypothetical protein CEUSTIGMA_g4863.t1 [Chlamydomonas eustigma]